MQFIISGKNMELTDALKDYVEEKIGKLDKVLEGETSANVTLSTEKNLHVIDVQVNVSDRIYRAEIEEEDMYVAIDKVSDVILGQIRKTKAKKDKLFKSDTIRGKEYVSSIEREKVKGEVVKYIVYPMKPMSVEDAIIILNQNDDVFFTFINIDTEKVNVLYKTNDGNYGLVEPEM